MTQMQKKTTIKYIIDFDKLFEYVVKRPSNDKNNESSITQVWQPDGEELKITSKEEIETKHESNPNLINMKYDFLNGLLSQITTVFGINDKIFVKEEDLSFGQKMILDSFIKEGFIKKIEE